MQRVHKKSVDQDPANLRISRDISLRDLSSKEDNSNRGLYGLVSRASKQYHVLSRWERRPIVCHTAVVFSRTLWPVENSLRNTASDLTSYLHFSSKTATTKNAVVEFPGTTKSNAPNGPQNTLRSRYAIDSNFGIFEYLSFQNKMSTYKILPLRVQNAYPA
jgi:hypothetical protein